MRRLKNGLSSPPGNSKKFDAVEEELALLRKEQREPRQVGAPLVHFGLGEVGVEREVGLERRRDVVERIEPDVDVAGRGRRASPRRVARRRRAGTVSDRGRCPARCRSMPPMRPAFDMRVSPSSRSQPVHRLSSFLRFTVR